MKFRYYLRGAGLGIIITTIILAIAFSKYKPVMSAEEIKAEAEKLGMVMPDDSASGNAESKNDDVTPDLDAQEPTSGKADNTYTEDLPDDVEGENASPSVVTIVINQGDYSDVVSEKLAQAGLIDDAEAFNKWFISIGLDDLINTGTYEIPINATDEEIIDIITKKN